MSHTTKKTTTNLVCLPYHCVSSTTKGGLRKIPYKARKEILKYLNNSIWVKCWECGTLFHPYKGFEATSHFCCCDCSNDYCEREIKNGVFKCRLCGKTYKGDRKKTEEYYGSCLCPECREGKVACLMRLQKGSKDDEI